MRLEIFSAKANFPQQGELTADGSQPERHAMLGDCI
jgi:hypothetical protein